MACDVELHARAPTDADRLHAVLAEYGACARIRGDDLELDVPLSSVTVETPQVAARVATYVAKRALHAAGAVVSEQRGLAVLQRPEPDREQTLVQAEGA